MSIQRKFNRQYDKWLLKCHADGRNRRWPKSMIFAIERLEKLLKKFEI